MRTMFPLHKILISLVHCLPFCAIMTYGLDCLSPQLLLNWPEITLRLRELCFLVWLGWWWLAGCKGNANIDVGANVYKNVQYILQILLNLINEVYVNGCPRGSRKPVSYSKWPLRWSRNNVFFFYLFNLLYFYSGNELLTQFEKLVQVIAWVVSVQYWDETVFKNNSMDSN